MNLQQEITAKEVANIVLPSSCFFKQKKKKEEKN